MSSTAPTLQDLEKTVVNNYTDKDLELVREVYEFADAAHAGQKRISGDPYITHPTATAIKLVEMRLGANVIAAGLLHDTLGNTKTTVQDIKKRFGSDIASMVEAESNLHVIRYRGIEKYLENLRKMFIAMAQDIRVIFIKFANRVHNLETLQYVESEDRRRRTALESLEIYAPIADRLGMGKMKGDLEDLSFQHAYPKEYQWVKSLTEKLSKEKEDYLAEVMKIAKDEIEGAGIKVSDIHGRVKHTYSFYKKLIRYDKDINRIYDSVAVRVVVNSLADCYATLGIIHNHWKPLTGRIKDYVAQPKPNGYQSVHTTVFCKNGEIVEFQIRTPDMHEEARYGVAAHWRYKEGDEQTGDSIHWIEQLVDIQKKISDKGEFLENLEALKIDIFQDRIFVFTPEGDVIDLPEGGTPIDFAYNIHTDVGNQCTGAKVNEKITPLDAELKSGDVVEIITNKNRKGPNPDWLNFVKSHHARSKIKAATRHTLKKWVQQKLSDK